MLEVAVLGLAGVNIRQQICKMFTIMPFLLVVLNVMHQDGVFLWSG